MPDDLTKRGREDRKRISKQPHEQVYQKRRKNGSKAMKKK